MGAGERRRRGLRALASLAACAAGIALLALAVTTPLDLETQVGFSAGAFAAALLAGRRKGPLATLALVMLSLASSGRYLHWRLTSTMPLELSVDAALGALLLFAELFAFLALVFGYLQAAVPLERRPAPLPDDERTWPSVDVFIPTYNEPLEIVRTTILAARALDWPADKLRVYVLDDGRRAEFRAFAEAVGVGYLIRPDNAHAKAGNLNHALTRTRGELVAIFDCDHVPTRSFLQTTVGWFLRSPRMALVQTPHHFYSPDPFERNLDTFGTLPNEGELFYGRIQPANDAWNGVFFCGSCAVLRRSALEEVGGIAVETVTEDAHTALRMHRRGWESAYLDVPQAAGLATESLSGHVGQRIRWARGMAQIFRLDNPFLGRGLSLLQRLSYAASMLHFFSGIPRLIFLAAPLAYLLFERQIFNALPLLALAYALPHLLHSKLTMSRVQGRFRHSFWSEVYETCLAYYTAIPTTMALVSPRKGRFNVTAKGGLVETAYFEKAIARPYLALLALNVLGLAAGLFKLATGRAQVDVLAVNLAWTVYNLVLIAATLAVAFERRQRRESPRIAAQLPAMLRLADGSTLCCRTVDLSRGGARLALPAGAAALAQERVALTLRVEPGAPALPADVVACSGATARVRFAAMSLEEEGALVRALFSRADAWTGARDGRAPDRPLAAFAQISVHALRALVLLARALRPVQAEGSAVPAAARGEG